MAGKSVSQPKTHFELFIYYIITYRRNCRLLVAEEKKKCLYMVISIIHGIRKLRMMYYELTYSLKNMMEYFEFYIFALLSVPTPQLFPTVDKCKMSDYCHLCSFKEVSLNCTIIGRPAVNLTWDSNINMSGLVQSTGVGPSSDMFLSYIAITVPLSMEETVLFKCIPSGLSITKSTKNASVLLSGPVDPIHLTDVEYTKINENMYEPFLELYPNYETFITQTAGIHFSSQEPTCHAVVRSDQYLDSGPLILTSIYRDGESYSRHYSLLQSYQEPTINNSSFIDSCSDMNNCTIDTFNGEAKLTCSVNKTRPAADIEWKIKRPNSASVLRVSSSTSCIFDLCSSSSSVTILRYVTTGNVTLLECITSIPGSDFKQTSIVSLTGNGKISMG